MKYNAILFDFDGTIMDSSQGIIATAKYTASQMRIPIPTDVNWNHFIGPALEDCFRIVFHLDESRIKEATDIYMKRYNEDGQFKASFYPNVISTLKELQNREIAIAVATLKTTKVAVEMGNYFGLGRYFSDIFGKADRPDDTKGKIIQRAIDKIRVPKNQILMVGDSPLDSEGARVAGIDFVGVSYGFGDMSNEKGIVIDDLSKLLDIID